MTKFARILSILFGIIFFAFFITFLILMWLIPGRSFATVFLTPSVCPNSCTGLGGGGGPGNLFLSNLAFNDIGIRYEWPKQMNLNSSDNITIDLAFKVSDTMAYRSTPAPGGNYKVAETTPSFFEGTPYVQIQGTPSPASVAQTFGPGYQTFADVQLLTNTFDIKTFQPTRQSLNQNVVSWVWNVKPLSLGPQVINLDINFFWQPTGKGQIIEHQIWQTQVSIDVTQPFLDPGQISVGTTISGALAAGGLITAIITNLVTLILDRFRAKDGENGKDSEKKPQEGNTTLNSALMISILDYLREKDGEGGNVQQQKPETDNQGEVNQQEVDIVGKVQVQAAKRPVQSQQRRRALIKGVQAIVQSRRRELSIMVRALLIVIAISIVIGTAFTYYTKILHPAQIKARATAMVVDATATAQAPLTATAITEQHLLTTLTSSSPVLNTVLNGNKDNGGWMESASCSFNRGSYHSISAKQGYLYFCLARLTFFANFVYQVQLSIKSGSAGCLILRYSVSSNKASYDGFCIDNSGSYSFISHAMNETSFNYLRTGSTTLMKGGTDAKNTVIVIAQGAQYTVYINGQYVLALADNTTSQGAIGVGAIDNYGSTGVADVAFSEAKVWEPGT